MRISLVVLFSCVFAFGEEPAVKPPAPPPEDPVSEKKSQRKPVKKPAAAPVKSKKEIIREAQAARDLRSDEIISAMRRDQMWDGLTFETTLRIRISVGRLAKFNDSSWTQLSFPEKYLIRTYAPEMMP